MTLVVGAAIVRNGTVLAARRTYPPEAAGRWEFPGGKVHADETPADALVREIVEELSVDVTVDAWLDFEPRSERSSAISLRVATCRLPEDATPHPRDHDELRWICPEELDELDWLEPDRPFLPALREHLLNGEHLAGNVGGASRVGSTVRRPTGPWTPRVHALLTHLGNAGLPKTPRVLGFDARGREVLDYLPGSVPGDEPLTDAQLAAIGSWLRSFHGAVADLPLTGTWRFFGVAEPSIIAHNDVAPYNVCFVGDALAGVFDWDLAGPSTPLMELAHTAWTSVPLNRPLPAEEAARRLWILADGYAGPSSAEILAAVADRVKIAIDGIRIAAASGDGGMQNLRAVGEPEATQRLLDDFLTRRAGIAAALR